MNRTKLATIFTAVGMLAIFLVPNIALAIDWSFTGFVRQEIAVSITNDKNPNNASTNAYTEGATPATTSNPAVSGQAPAAVVFNPGGAFFAGLPAEERGIFSFSPSTCPFFEGTDPLGAGGSETPLGALNAALIAAGGDPCVPNLGGDGIAEDKTINMFNSRAELDIQANNITDN
ncbi:MAG TPA: hypothetical protein QF901_00590, partial [Gammaproteobacteria bacterium]|nr:hypothetical protein [Gammaproteobacteria bacterium]